MKRRTAVLTICILVFSLTQICWAGPEQDQGSDSTDDLLVVLWTSGDRDVALKMVFMYTLTAKTMKWWKDITFIVWGPSSKLLSGDKEIQAYMAKMIEAGVVVKACKACADQYGVSDQIASLGIEVKYMGQELTGYVKNRNHLVTF